MNSSTCTIDLEDRQAIWKDPATGSRHEHPERFSGWEPGLTAMKVLAVHSLSRTFQTATAIIDPWREEEAHHGAAATVRTAPSKMLINDLGWSKEQALETRMRLRTFEEDWDAPGMEGYDDL